jgi:phospholipid-binding lipoprotein MlaA
MFDPVSRGYAFVVPKPARIGLAAGPHLALPFFGPSNLRDAIGFSVDSAIAPTTNASLKYQIPDNTEKALGLSAFYYLNKNSLHPGGYENLKKMLLMSTLFFETVTNKKEPKILKNKTIKKLKLKDIPC